MIFFFFLMLLAMFGLELTIMFRDKNKEIVSIFLRMELGMLYQFIYFCKIAEMNVETLDQDEQGNRYGDYFCHKKHI